MELVKKATAILRIILPKTNIPATTASSTSDPNARAELLKIGANVLMPNISPDENKSKYELYPDKSCISVIPDIEKMSNAVINAGKEICMDIGNSIAKEIQGENK